MRLSKNFKLEEFLLSQTAARNGIDMTPSDEIIESLARLCQDVLQPAREVIGSPFFITSGYRPPILNRLIGGSPTSAHMFGRAADFVVMDHTPYQVADFISGMNLPYDQLIHEFGRWVHIGIAKTGNTPRLEDLTASRFGQSTQYQRGIVEV